MIKTCQWIRDYTGVNILAIQFSESELSGYLDELSKEIGEEEFQKFTTNKSKYESQDFLLLIADGVESLGLSQLDQIDKKTQIIQKVLNYPVEDILFLGLGKSVEGDNISYYIMVRSETIDEFRTLLALGKIPLSIGLGFYPRDTSRVGKINKIEKTDPFLKLFRQEYYKEGNFEFIKRIENYHLPTTTMIYPIKINPTHANFRDNLGNFFTVALVLDKLRITSIWVGDNKTPYLSQTLISRKFDKI